MLRTSFAYFSQFSKFMPVEQILSEDNKLKITE